MGYGKIVLGMVPAIDFTVTKENEMGTWKDPYRILDAEREERDYHEGFQDGDYSKRGQTCAMRYQENCTLAYNREFKEASGYTPKEWAAL